MGLTVTRAPSTTALVDRVARPLGVGHRGHHGSLRGTERPVGLILGALIDPASKVLYLVGAERLATPWHPGPCVLIGNPMKQKPGSQVRSGRRLQQRAAMIADEGRRIGA